MDKYFKSIGIALRLWLITALYFSLLLTFILYQTERTPDIHLLFICLIVTTFGSLPAFIALFIGLPLIRNFGKDFSTRMYWLLFLQFLITLPYAFLGGLSQAITLLSFNENRFDLLPTMLIISGVLFFCSGAAMFTVIGPVRTYLSWNTIQVSTTKYFYQPSKFHTKMETDQPVAGNGTSSNRILIKGLITGGLILLMLIPTIFIYNLTEEREARQREVVLEVSSKWASAQTLSGPFLTVPYTDTFMNSDGRAVATKTHLILLADDLDVSGQIVPEQRPRSIYKVLLYKSAINIKGAFKVKWPTDINQGNIDYANAKLCFTLSDFKGIEEEIYVKLDTQSLLLTPGLPLDDFGKTGLSVPVNLDPAQAMAGIPFSMHVKIKGSEQLHFVPMSASSKFSLQSKWPSPSFDGDMLPNERSVADSGFSASWNFNQANLPFATVLKENTAPENKLAFGVSLVQPADQYDKTLRSVKYAILFIGLTFAFFFIIEIMQKRPFHPVQYVLVGLALVIFYSLLLSISEYILFDYAYLVAASATILLISLYAKGHFRSWGTAAIFFVLLSCLYGFIFILIRLEDTALLVGSIGLFVVLAAAMFASRKINWYGTRVEN